MDKTYTVIRGSPDGPPIEIRCEAHEGCTWSMEAGGAKRDDDIIFRVQFANHLKNADPGRPAHGQLRRERAR